MKYAIALILLLPSIALAADLVTSWDAVTLDDAGQPLAAPVTEYRIYACGAADPIAVVPAAELEHTEAGVIAGSGTYCREISAYAAPFEGARAQGVVVLVVPGQSSNVRVQAIQ